MNYSININSFNDIILYLNDIDNYVNSILHYHNNYNENLDIKEILMYLSSVHEIIENLKYYLYQNYYE